VDEQGLVESACRGSIPAFNALVLRYQGVAYNVAFRLLGDSPAAEDATQEAFLAAYRAMSDFRGGSFRAWLLRIVTNKCWDQIRTAGRRPTLSLDALPEESDRLFYLAGRSELPDQALERRTLTNALEQAILTLPPEQRAVLVLADVQGLGYAEVAMVVGLPLGTVRSRLSRARARLRDRLWAHRELLPAWVHSAESVQCMTSLDEVRGSMPHSVASPPAGTKVL
jgi:RNA polymerase sigma-70 factor, ECF subfamily